MLQNQPEIAIDDPKEQMSYDVLKEPKQLLLMNTQDCRVPFSKWLELLSSADFFIASLGGHMPLCHNIVEALSMGSIPILQYAEYLKPVLEDVVNCLTYKNEAELIPILQKALGLSKEKKLEMKQATISYYESHLKVGMLVEKISSNSSRVQTLVLFDFWAKK